MGGLCCRTYVGNCGVGILNARLDCVILGVFGGVECEIGGGR